MSIEELLKKPSSCFEIIEDDNTKKSYEPIKRAEAYRKFVVKGNEFRISLLDKPAMGKDNPKRESSKDMKALDADGRFWVDYNGELTPLFRVKKDVIDKDKKFCMTRWKLKWHNRKIWDLNVWPLTRMMPNANYNEVFEKYNYSAIFQIGKCNLDSYRWLDGCWFCFVNKEVNNGKRSRFVSAEWIMDNFLDLRKYEPEKGNRLRFSGGQPTLAMELAYTLLNLIEENSLENIVYFTNDTNFSTGTLARDILGKSRFHEMCPRKNYGTLGCFKGLAPMDYFWTTGANPRFFESQFKSLKMWIDAGADLHPHIECYVPGNKKVVKAKVSYFMDRLEEIDKKLPLKIGILWIDTSYLTTQERCEMAKKCGRIIPGFNPKRYKIWHKAFNPKLIYKYWDKELKKRYKRGYDPARNYKIRL